MQENSKKTDLKNQRGSAGVKFLAIGVVLFLIGHAGFNYIPTAYECEAFKQRMQETVMNAYAMPNAPTSNPESVTAKIRGFFAENNIPPDAYLKVEKENNGGMKAHVYFKKKVNILPFGVYQYDYEFNHTATPNGFLTK